MLRTNLLRVESDVKRHSNPIVTVFCHRLKNTNKFVS